MTLTGLPLIVKTSSYGCWNHLIAFTSHVDGAVCLPYKTDGKWKDKFEALS